MEKWKRIHDFPDYSVSSEGRVRNDGANRIMALTRNQQGIIQVGLTRDRTLYKRSVPVLVAHAFLPRAIGPFDTPIHIDGDRSNCGVDNLMWRPRWFAVMYHQQFHRRYPNSIGRPIIDVKTKEVCDNSFDCAVRYGLLEKDVVLSIANNTVVWPTMQQFQVMA